MTRPEAAPLVVGLTGGIGSGKSTVARIFACLGIPVYDTDAQAKRLMADDARLRKDLVDLVGAEAYSEGRLDRRVLASYVFQDRRHAQAINRIVHPRVKADFQEWVLANGQASMLLVESAILFESGLSDLTHVNVAVTAPRELRILRTMRRDGASREKVLERMALQMDDPQLCERASACIVNDGAHSLVEQVFRLITSLS